MSHLLTFNISALDPKDPLLSQLTADGRDHETKSTLDPIQQPNHAPKRAKSASTLQLQTDQREFETSANYIPSPTRFFAYPF